MKHKAHIFALLLLLSGIPALAQDGADRIRINQIGFYPDAPKEAVVIDAPPGAFLVVRETTGETVYHSMLGASRTWSFSGETMRRADFSSLREPGSYVLIVPGVGTSYPFTVDYAVHRPVATAALKGYYYQRMSLALDPQYAGVWARPAGHPDTIVRVHASAATAQRPVNTLIAAPRGWYDAGDFNKYIVNSGISTYTLLALHEHYPAFAAALEADIPESGDAIPDVLDEALWNLRWMLAMQDPTDGGVYHKLTHANFQGIIMPHQATATRYVVQKSTAATLDFAAVMAQAARIFDAYAATFPGLADSMRTAALEAWQWARSNPNIIYNQTALNQQYDPDIRRGEYGGSGFGDELAWAAAELYVTTGADSFLTAASPLAAGPDIPWWGSVRTLGWYTLLHHREQVAAVADTTAMKRRYLSFADGLANSRSPYGTVMGTASWNFGWGSNAVAANQAMALLQAFRLSPDSTYLWAALSNLDYLLGRNATGFSFVTGQGAHPPMHPHHRPSQADAVSAPVPGLLAGGPNPDQQDGCTYASDLPARSYVDDWCSYASNEIAINWNAPLVYMAAALEAALAGTDAPTAREPEDLGVGSPLRLLPSYPNPAEGQTMLTFDLPESAEVHLEAFDMLGRRVATWEPQQYTSGRHQLVWTMQGLADGLYVVRLVAGPSIQSQKVVKAGR